MIRFGDAVFSSASPVIDQAPRLMISAGRRRLKRFAISTSIALAAAIIAGFLIGPVAAFLVSVAGLLGVAIASDDNLGTCFTLSLLFVIGLGILAVALVTIINFHTGGSGRF